MPLEDDEHNDDVEPEVTEGAAIEREHFTEVAEDIEDSEKQQPPPVPDVEDDELPDDVADTI